MNIFIRVLHLNYAVIISMELNGIYLTICKCLAVTYFSFYFSITQYSY